MNAAMVESCVEPASSASENTIVSIAGSARVANIASRLAPKPPKLVPTSMPASDQREAPEAEQRDDGDEVGGPGEQQAGREGRHQRRGDPGRGEDEVGRDAEQRGGAVGDDRLLAGEPVEVAIGLHDGAPRRRVSRAFALRTSPVSSRRERDDQRHLQELENERSALHVPPASSSKQQH